MKSVLLIILSLVSCLASAQIVIGTGTKVAQANSPIIMVKASGNLVNNASFDFSSTNLNIELNGPVTAISGNWSLTSLRFNADNVINLDGLLTVSSRLEFLSGIIQPSSASKFSYLGTSENLEVAGDQSYVDGAFFQTGNGNRQFPIGTASTYAPVRFPEVEKPIEIGVQAFDADPGLVPDNIEVLDVNSGRYWRVTTSDFSQLNSRVNLSTRGMTIPKDDSGSPTVVQSSDLGGAAINLKTSSVNDDDVTSAARVTAAILAIGKQDKILVKIHDLITPFLVDGVNDRLFVENIERFSIRKVTILDRYGKLVKEWGNEYTNTIDYDFTKLSPGNYICVAEYGNEGAGTAQVSQMITVLKTNADR